MPQLTSDKLFNELKNKNIEPVYYLCGEESYLKNLAIEQIKKIINPDEFNFISVLASSADISEVFTTINTPPAFCDRRLVVIRQADKLKPAEKKDFIEYVQNPLATTCLVFETEQRKQTEILSKTCQKHAVKTVFYAMSETQVLKWLEKYASNRKFKINAESIRILIDLAGCDMTMLTNELNKIFLYLADAENKQITRDVVLQCLGFSKEENPFELSRFLLAKNVPAAVGLMEKLILSRQEPLFLLSLITNTATKILKVKRMLKAGLATDEIFGKAGLNRYFERNFINDAKKFTSEEKLLSVLEKSLEIENLLKSSKNADPKTFLKGLAVKLIST